VPRRPFGRMFELIILSTLDTTIPYTTEYIRNIISTKTGKPGLSWHTIKKYLIFLRDSHKIEEIHVGKTTTYKLKKISGDKV